MGIVASMEAIGSTEVIGSTDIVVMVVGATKRLLTNKTNSLDSEAREFVLLVNHFYARYCAMDIVKLTISTVRLFPLHQSIHCWPIWFAVSIMPAFPHRRSTRYR